LLALPGVLVEEGLWWAEEDEEKGCLDGVVVLGVREGMVVVEEEEKEEVVEPRRLGVPWKREGVGMFGRGGMLQRRGSLWGLRFCRG
jgi:hypothetical protein